MSEVSQEDLKDIHIGKLKQLAKRYGVQARRDWDKDKYIAAIKEAQEAGVKPDLTTSATPMRDEEEAERLIANYSLPVNQTTANAKSDKPKPGYARIIVHKDPTPGHANSPIQVGLNGKYINIPRGVAVDVEIPFLGVLRDAVQIITRQVQEPDRDNLSGKVVEEEVLSYPFQIVAITPGDGKFNNSFDQRSQSAMRRKAFHNEFKRWPTDGELLEWEKQNAARGR